MLVAVGYILCVTRGMGLNTGDLEAGMADVEDWLGATVTIGASPTRVCVIVGSRPRLVGLSLGEACEGCLHVKCCSRLETWP